MKLDTISQELIGLILPALNNSTVDVLDNKGITVASSNLNRIGKVNKELQNDKKKVYTIPIKRNSKILGKVQYYGQSKDIKEKANLLAMCIGIQFKQMILINKREVEKDARDELLKILIRYKDGQQEKVNQLSSFIKVYVKMPIRVILIRLESEHRDEIEKLKKLRYTIRILYKNKCINKNLDVYGIINHYVVIIKSIKPKSKYNILEESIYSVLKEHKIECNIGISSLTRTFEEIANAYAESVFFINRSLNVNVVEDERYNMDELIHHLQNGYGREYATKMYEKLMVGYSFKDMPIIMETVEVYYNTEGSINKTAEILSLHKNTVLYRMNKVYKILGLEEASSFKREFFLRLILDYYRFK